MGRDNSPKIRQRQQLERKQGKRPGYERILIVSEGSKTEPLYFGEIRSHYRLPTAHIAIFPSEIGTDPRQVVEYARQLFTNGDPQKDIQPRAFERIFAVFDRDDHLGYFDALDRAKSLDKKLRNDNREPVSFEAIPSIPSFELWLLLHFEDIRSPLHRTEVIKRLKHHIPNYEKGRRDIFAITRPLLDTAHKHALGLAQRSNASVDTEPYTAITYLVSLLTKLRD